MAGGLRDWGDISKHYVRRFSFALTEEVYEAVRQDIPDYAGILVCKGRYLKPVVVKPAKVLQMSKLVDNDLERQLLLSTYHRYHKLRWTSNLNAYLETVKDLK